MKLDKKGITLVDKNKGFTLIELLSVIVIMGLLLVIMIPAITDVSENSKTSLRNSKIKTMISSAEKYGNDTINSWQKCSLEGGAVYAQECTMTPLELIDYLDESTITDPITNETFNGKLLFCYNSFDISVDVTYLEVGQVANCS